MRVSALFPIDLLFTVKGSVEPISEVDRMIQKLGLSLRLTGRDLMRLGGTIDRAITPFLTRVNQALSGSLDWEAGLEDISWALEDVGSVIGDILAPFIDIVVDLLEDFADALEQSPVLQFLVLLGIGILLFTKLISKVLTAVGAFTLYSGTLMIAGKAHLGLGASLRALTIGFTEGKEAMLAYIASVKGIGTEADITKNKLLGALSSLKTQKATLLANKKTLEENAASWAAYAQGLPDYQEKLKLYEAEIARTNRALLKNEIQTETVTDQLENMGVSTTEGASGLKKEAKSGRSLTDTLKGGTKAAAKFALGGLLLGGVVSFLIANFEPLQDLFQTIGDLLIDLFEPLGPIIESFVDWMEANPELAKTLIGVALAIGAVLLVGPKLFDIFSNVGSFVAKAVGKLFDFVQAGDAVSAVSWKMTLANAALVAATAALVAAIAYLFSVFGSLGVNVWEGVAAVAALFGAILGFLAGLSLLSELLGSTSENVFLGVAAFAALLGVVSLFLIVLTQILPPLLQVTGGVQGLTETLLGLAAAMGVFALIATLLGLVAPLAMLGAVAMFFIAAGVAAFGAALIVAGIGLQIVAKGLNDMMPAIQFLVAAAPGLLAASVALGALAVSAGLAAISFGALALSVGALALALGALAIPLGVIAAIGGPGAVTEALRHLPTFEEGGVVTKTGIAVVHAGEEIVPAKGTPGTREVYNTFYITATIREEADITKLAQEINRLQGTEIGRTR